ncbi:hypothetical protein GCM10009785_24610 [Brooklawnia cerclae]
MARASRSRSSDSAVLWADSPGGSQADAFRAVHAHERRSRAARTLGMLAGVVALAAFAGVLPGMASGAVPAPTGPPGGITAPPSAAPAVPGQAGDSPTGSAQPGESDELPPSTGSAGSVDPANESQPLPSLEVSEAPNPTQSQAGSGMATGPAVPRELRIEVGATGYQAEIDRCQWVRMDLGAVAPIVAAHDYCGGSVVLDLLTGDRVDLAGQGLDGRYVVAGSRDARPGQDAAEATAGLVATVLLQTCYPDGAHVRLVVLVPVDASPSSTPGES